VILDFMFVCFISGLIAHDPTKLQNIFKINNPAELTTGLLTLLNNEKPKTCNKKTTRKKEILKTCTRS